MQFTIHGLLLPFLLFFYFSIQLWPKFNWDILEGFLSNVVKMVVSANERHNKHFGFSWGFQAPATLVSSSYLKMNGDTKRFPALKRSSMHCIDFGSLTLQLIQTVLQFSAPNVHILFRVTPKKVSRFFRATHPFKKVVLYSQPQGL